MNDNATIGKISVSELSVGSKVGDNIIVIALTRADAGFIKDVLRQ